MASYGVSGMARPAAGYRRRGLLGIIAVAVIVLGTVAGHAIRDDGDITVRIHTTTVGGGISSGSAVLLNGAVIGRVSAVSAHSPTDRVVSLRLTRSAFDHSLLTTRSGVSYAPRNLFGISAVVLRGVPGGQPLRQGSEFIPDVVDDATLSTLLQNLNDVNDRALHPYFTDVLDRLSQATMGLAPILGVAGQVGDELARTQRSAPRTTLPQLARLTGLANDALRELLPAVSDLAGEPQLRQKPFRDRQRHLLDLISEPLLSREVASLLGPGELALLDPVAPTIVEIAGRVQSTFPDARENGLQLRSIIDRIRNAMPDSRSGPVLNIDVVLDSIPAVAGALERQR